MYTVRRISRASLIPGWLGLPALLLGIAVLVGCDTATSAQSDPEPPRAGAFLQALDNELQFSDAQWSVMQRHQSALTAREDDPAPRAPGALWFLAADLNDLLSASQKERFNESTRTLQRELRREMRGERQGPRDRRARLRDRMQELLTEAQQEEVRTLRMAQRDAMQAAREQLRAGTLTPEAFRTRVEELRAAFRSDVETLLTDAQRTALQERREAASERRAARQAARADVLALTEAQQDALTEARQTMREQMRSIRRNHQGAVSDRSAMREAMREARAALRAALQETLTEQQMAILQIHRGLTVRVRTHAAERRDA